MATQPLDFTISPRTSEADFLPLAKVEEAAFSGPKTTLFFSLSATPRHTHIFHNDPTALYLKASLPSGQIIGLAKWNLFATAGPHFPWPKEEFAEDANVELLAWIFWTVG
jgi:hypothetical protein